MKYLAVLFIFWSHILSAQTGNLEINPTTCVLEPNASTCSVTATWTTSNASDVCLWRYDGQGQTPARVSCHLNQTTGVNYNSVTLGGKYLDLRYGSHVFEESISLETIFVQAIQPSGTLTVNPSSCELQPGQNHCTVYASWTSANANDVCLWRYGSGLTPAKVSCASNNSNVPYTYVSLSGKTLDLRYGSQNFNDSYSLDSKIVYATASNAITGGSVFSWYHHNTDPGPDMNDHTQRLTPYGIIKQYHEPNIRPTVLSLLQSMYQNGQRTLGVDFFHSRNQQFLTHGTYINTRAKVDSLGNVYYIEPQFITNLEMFLADIKAAGFDRILFNVMTGGCNSATVWRSWYLNCQKDLEYTFNGTQLITDGYDPADPEPRWQQTPLWRENWRVLKKLTETLEASNIEYLIDLQNEAMPVDNMMTLTCSNEKTAPEQCMSSYPSEHALYQERAEKILRKKWIKYKNNFGKQKTTGFSIIASSLYQVQHRTPAMNFIYNGDYPLYQNLHMYVTDENTMIDVFNFMKNIPGNKVIIGETYYNDPLSAQAFANASFVTSTEIEYLIQWPRSRTVGYVYNPPMSFSNYLNQGF